MNLPENTTEKSGDHLVPPGIDPTPPKEAENNDPGEDKLPEEGDEPISNGDEEDDHDTTATDPDAEQPDDDEPVPEDAVPEKDEEVADGTLRTDEEISGPDQVI